MLTYSEMESKLPQIYQAFELPLLLYKTDQPERTITFPNEEPFTQLLLPYQTKFDRLLDPVHYHINELFYTVGCFWNKELNYKLIIGPLPSTIVSESTAKSLLHSSNIKSDSEKIRRIIDLPRYQHLRFLNILSLLSQTIQDLNIAPMDIKNIITSQVSIPVAEKKTEMFYQTSEEQNFHNSLDFEKQYLTYIEEGNLEKLGRLLEKPVKIDAGIIANDNLRQIKNLFIASITLSTRAAIRGGLEPQIAYQISDLAIQEVEKLNNVELIHNWQRSILFELTTQVSKTLPNKTLSPLIQKCLNYIATHINEPLTVYDIADKLYQNRSYLSRIFKSEVGQNLSDYILERKLLEAQDLLRFSNRSISEISNFLAFSSQSYFQTVFKKQFGITPLHYRKQMQRTQ